MGSFLQEMFLRFGGAFKSWDHAQEADRQICSGALTQAVEHVVDETYSRMRFLPGYARRLQKPVAATFQYIDQLVEDVPGAVRCSRSAFSEDPRVNAFFVDPRHLQEVFSENAEVRALRDARPDAEECWALLCMKKEERQHLGMSLVGDAVQKEVMQTVVSFTDHQILAPGPSEEEARHSLKCCIFNGLLEYVRKQADTAKTRAVELETRRKSLIDRQDRMTTGSGGESRQMLQSKIEDLERELGEEVPRLASLEDHLDLVAGILASPTQFLSGGVGSIHLGHLGVKLVGKNVETGNRIRMFEIQIASKGTRVGVLVRFPLGELLPRRDFVRTADLFLSL